MRVAKSNPSQACNFSLPVSGEMAASGGLVAAQYGDGNSHTLWQNSDSYHSPQGTLHSSGFTIPTGVIAIQFSYMFTMDKGWLAFSEPQLQWLDPGDTITRKTYALGGKPIATRISGNQEGDNGLFYIHTDHLGSNSVMSYGQGHGGNTGNKVDGSTARYLPFGDWRVEPSHYLTDQVFTGQKHNMDLGLYYYNARFYLPYMNRQLPSDWLKILLIRLHFMLHYPYGRNGQSPKTAYCTIQPGVCCLAVGRRGAGNTAA